jgi:hypothetical protein
MRKLLHEPLVHFLLLGAVIFAVSSWFSKSAGSAPDSIIVTQGQVEVLAVGFTRTWQRPPTRQELEGLIAEYVREEVLYREAMAMGLDRDDTIVRRRMRQKLEFLTEDVAAQSAAPTDQELQVHLNQHADKFCEQPRYAFEHIFFSRERRKKSAEADARAVLAQLNGPKGSAIDVETLGDTFLLPFHFGPSSGDEIARLFGESFSQRVAEAEAGRWTGPFESSYGLHLVLVHQRVPGEIPALAMVREAVLRDMLAERRKQALEAAYAKLRQRYNVVVEPPAPQVAEAR